MKNKIIKDVRNFNRQQFYFIKLLFIVYFIQIWNKNKDVIKLNNTQIVIK